MKTGTVNCLTNRRYSKLEKFVGDEFIACADGGEVDYSPEEILQLASQFGATREEANTLVLNFGFTVTEAELDRFSFKVLPPEAARPAAVKDSSGRWGKRTAVKSKRSSGRQESNYRQIQ